MIFVTVGMRLPFDRLVRAVDDWAALHPETPVFGQILYKTPDCDWEPYVPRHMEYAAEIGPAAFEDYCRKARCIVGHAGTGTLIAAMTHRKPLIMMTRQAKYGEHRNDHQVATAEHFRELPGVTVVQDAEEMGAAIDRVMASGTAETGLPSHADPQLIATIRNEIFRAV